MSPHLSDKNIFPSFFRVTTPEQNLTKARMHLLKFMNWSRVFILYQNFNLFSTLNEYMTKHFKDNNITVVRSFMFTTSPHNWVARLKEADARIIIGNFYEDMARKVMCAAYSMPGGAKWYKKVVWFLPSFLDHGWMNVPFANCSSHAIKEVLGQYFTIGSIWYHTDQSYQAVGNLSHDFFQEYNLFKEVEDDIPEEFRHMYEPCRRDKENCTLYAMHRATGSFDAVWAIALALNNTLRYLEDTGDSRRLEHFAYGQNDSDLPCIIRSGMENLTFQALSGPFRFNSKGEATSEVQIIRYNNSGDQAFTRVGNCNYDVLNDWSCVIDDGVIHWDTVDGKPPYDGIQTRTRVIKIELWIMGVIFSVASLGVMTSLGLLVFNIWYRNHRIIKMSSPRLNNLILVGSIIGYIDIILQDRGTKAELTVCMIRLFTKPLAFSLVFGSLFAKTWRVYEIFTAGAHAYKLNKKLLRDSSLLLIVAVLVAINCAILGTWMVMSPQQAVTTNISVTEADESSHVDTEYVNQFHHCDSELETEFVIAMGVVNGLVLIFGTFLAVQTRKVSYPEFNDSRLIAMAIYNVMIVEPVGEVMMYAINDKPVIRYALYSILQMTKVSVTIALLFVPKVISHRRHAKDADKFQESRMKSDVRHTKSVLGTVVMETDNYQFKDRKIPQKTNNNMIKRNSTGISLISSPDPVRSNTRHSSLKKFNQGEIDSNGGEYNTQHVKHGDGSKIPQIRKLSTFEKQNCDQESFDSNWGDCLPMKTFHILPPQNGDMALMPVDHSCKKRYSNLMSLRKSFSDTNLDSVVNWMDRLCVKKEDENEADKDGYSKTMKENEMDKPVHGKKRLDRICSNVYHDDKVIQSIKFKTGVKVKAKSLTCGRSRAQGFKASWKEKGNVTKTDIVQIREILNSLK